MKKSILATALVAACAHAPASFATNWFQLQNNEQPGAAPYKFWGFLQPTYTYIESNTVTGIPATVVSPVNGASVAVPAGLRAYNGQTALFNLVGPDLEHSDQLQMFRARPGVRGVIPGTDEKINYFLLGEIGNNGLTRERPAVFSDATATFNYIPGARIRVGLGRLPLGEEAMTGVQVLDYINFTNVSDQLLNERFVEPYTNASRTHAAVVGAPLAMSQLKGAFGGYRDVGVEVYDWFNRGRWEYAYAVMVSRANGISFSDDLNPGNHDVTARVQAAYVFQGSGPKREDVTAYAWHQEGKRAFGGTDYTRIREGIGAKYLRHGLRMSGEYIRAKGMIYVAPTPQFNDIGAPAFEPVDYVALDSRNKADGYYLDAGWKFSPQWEVDLRYDELSKMTNSAYDERRTSTWTVGAQYFYSPKLRFALNYEIRDIKVVHPEAQLTNGQKIQGTAAAAIGASAGDRISAQLTWVF
ncbi:MAG: porin [Sulfurimicrobium sp.]